MAYWVIYHTSTGNFYSRNRDEPPDELKPGLTKKGFNTTDPGRDDKWDAATLAYINSPDPPDQNVVDMFLADPFVQSIAETIQDGSPRASTKPERDRFAAMLRKMIVYEEQEAAGDPIDFE